ncbi:MAG TPA: hypothetical protein VFK94_02145 [Patescibacteria group bacterium]|nr:hypothetical protein [Patescibacteria group bacterium]
MALAALISPKGTKHGSGIKFNSNVILLRDRDNNRLDFIEDNDSAMFSSDDIVERLRANLLGCQFGDCDGKAVAVRSAYSNDSWDIEYLCAFHVAVFLCTKP